MGNCGSFGLGRLFTSSNEFGASILRSDFECLIVIHF